MSYTSLLWVSLSYNPSLLGALPAGFTGSKLYGWSAYSKDYFTASQIRSLATNGAAPQYGAGVLAGTSVGLNSTLVSLLRTVQRAMDLTGVGLGASWGVADVQPCPPWQSSRSADYPGQNASAPGYGRAWLGLVCSDWDGTTPSFTSLLGGAGSLSLKRLGMVGNLSTALCALFPSLTMLDVSQNALSGTLLPCFGAQVATVASRFTLSVFDNNFVGTVPQSYTALSWMAISYNPGLFGALPAGLGASQLVAWSGYQNECVHLAARPARHAGRLTPLPRRRLLARAAATTRTTGSPLFLLLMGASPLCTLCTRAVRTRLELTPVCPNISAPRRCGAAASCSARA